MAEEENEENAHLRPACVACTYHCNKIHGDRDLDAESYDPDRSWPFFRKKMSKLSLHQTPQAGICIPGAFMADYPNTFQNGKFITLEGPSGNKWRVAAIERSILHPGWRAFSHDHGLREDDVLDFKLMKPSHFVVDIFNSKGEVRRSARHARVTGKYSVDGSRKRKEPAVADQRCKITSKRSCLDSAMGPRLRYCEKTKQWERLDAREVVNLDSDADEPQRRSPVSKIDRLLEFMREEQENGIIPASKEGPVVDQVVEKRLEEENYEDDDPPEEETASNPLRQFTKMFERRSRKTKPNPDATPLSCDHDTVMIKEGDHNNVVLSSAIAHADDDYEPAHASKEVKVAIVNSSRLQGKVPDPGEFSLETLESDHTTTDVHPLKEGLISHELAKELDTLKLTEEAYLKQLTNSANTTDESMFQLEDCRLAKTEPGDSNPSTLENVKSGTKTSDEVNPQRKDPENQASMIKPDAESICVLISRRGRVMQSDRDRALHKAQAWVKRLPKACFIAVMNPTHVYKDFILDIPAGFAKQSGLPPKEVRVTLVSDAPPTNCKAVWKPGDDVRSSTLNASGWMKFSRAHFLEEGDVCVFEDLNKHPAVRIGVYIFRVVELVRPVVLDWERHYKVDPEIQKPVPQS